MSEKQRLGISTAGKRKHRLGTTQSVSTAGNRKQRLGSADSVVQATLQVLEGVGDNSPFFKENQPHPMPSFEMDAPSLTKNRLQLNTLSLKNAYIEEIDLGERQGEGEFGSVWALVAIHDRSHGNVPSSAGGQQEIKIPRKIVLPQDEPIAGSLIEDRDEMISSNRSNGIQGIHHRRNTSAITFAEDLKLPDSGDDDDSTLSTEDEDEPPIFDATDGEGELDFIRGYMSSHILRSGMARYAVKRVRQDLDGDVKLEAAIDLAIEAKFLASIRHPNIVRMRGTVGTMGTLDFMIVMDCLTLTLREKMKQWSDEAKGKHGILGKILRPLRNQDNAEALRKDQYADKILAAFDIARAMRYLHKHMILFRDLKPENVALDVRGEMRLFDFGLVKELKKKDLVEEPDSYEATGLTGSRRYMAPEVVLCKNYGLSADVYSYAIVFWEIFSDDHAYQNMSYDKHFEQVALKGKRPSKRALSSRGMLSKRMQQLLDDMWSPNPLSRPSFDVICDVMSNECLLSGLRNTQKASDGTHLSDRTNYLMDRSVCSRMSVASSGSA